MFYRAADVQAFAEKESGGLHVVPLGVRRLARIDLNGLHPGFLSDF